jgi:alpha-L-rhamnosidase
LKDAFQKQFVEADGSFGNNTQTAYILALKIGLLSKEQEPMAVRYLVDNMKRNDWHLSTGFMGVSYALSVLTEHGEKEAAFRLLLQEAFPSWLFPVLNGAATIWERWDDWTAEKGFQDPEMNSLNHYALGSVGEWIYRYLAGIDLAESSYGFQRFLIRPYLGGGFTHVSCRYNTLYGWVESSWEIEEGRFVLKIEVPANTTAEVAIHAKADSVLYVDDIPAFQETASHGSSGCTLIRREADHIWLQVGSGCYTFKSSVTEGVVEHE